jgi:Leucine-rich repeat (LRR) protein
LNDNQLSGSLSTAIGDLSSLTFLQIDNNQFTSTIPSEMGQLSGLSKYNCISLFKI